MTNNQELKKLLDQFTSKRILIVGDVMVDEYLWGEVNRISPEAPVPVVSCQKREHRMGGAANVAVNIKAMGAEPLICSVIGEDDAGRIFTELVKENGMSAAGLIQSPKRQTSMKTRVIGNHQHLLRVDHEITDFLDEDDEKRLLETLSQLLERETIHALIFQDYDKGVLTPKLIAELTKLAKVKNIPILVDPKKRSFLGYHGVDLFKPNFKELKEGLNLQLSKTDFKAMFEAVTILHQRNAIPTIMVTLSEKGVFVSDGREYEVIPAEERDIADVSGAGDTVIAVTALCKACGLDRVETARLANQAGGLVCERIGVIPITPEMFLNDGTKKPGSV